MHMCPLCIGTATLIVSGSSTAAGLAAVVFRRLAHQRPDERRDPGAHGPVSSSWRRVSTSAGAQPLALIPPIE